MKYENIPYKHRLLEREILQTSIFPSTEVGNDFVSLSKTGILVLEPKYMWDGASGPTWDTPNVKVPSAGHDGEFQLMREGLIDRDEWFLAANEDIYRWLRDRKMWRVRAYAWKVGLDKFGYKHTLPREVKIIEVK